MKDFIAYRGLDCEGCEARLATVRNDHSLRQYKGFAATGVEDEDEIELVLTL